MFLHDLFLDKAIGCVRIHAWMLCTCVTIVQKGKESLHFPRSAGVWLCVPSILSLLYLFLLPVFFLTHILFPFKPFPSFVTSLLLFECYFFGDWYRVEKLAIFPTNNLKISPSLVVCLDHMSFFFLAASKYSSSFCPSEHNCPKDCQTNPLLLSKWRLVCFIFDWSTQIILTG